MSKYKIIIQEDGQKKVHHCESFLLLMDAGEDNMKADLSLRDDIDTIRTLATCYRSIIAIVAKTGEEQGLDIETNSKRLKYIINEGHRYGLASLPKSVGGRNEPIQ